MAFIKKPAEFSYQTGSPVTTEQRDMALKGDFSQQIKDLTDTLPEHVQEHMKRQREINRMMGNQELIMNRAGNPIRGYR